MEQEIWRATEDAVRAIFTERNVRLSDEELRAVLQSLPIYLDAALIECALALANQERQRRRGGNGGHRGGST